MPRPVKWRKVENIPEYRLFKPANVPAFELEENILKIEELEAIRLKDLEGFDQETCADRMEISRQTFQRIYNSAKKKIADSLVNGKSISIKGGNYTRNICKIACENCGYRWKVRIEDIDEFYEQKVECPECGDTQYICKAFDAPCFGRRRCRNGQRGRNGNY